MTLDQGNEGRAEGCREISHAFITPELAKMCTILYRRDYFIFINAQIYLESSVHFYFSHV